jgi:DNA-binding MarR family transcriptional regulator
LADRLRKLEGAGVVRRSPGPVGDGVRYELTDRGWALAPVMAEIRRWGADELLGTRDETVCFDLSHMIPAELDIDESYVWWIDDEATTLTMSDRQLALSPGAAAYPALTIHTSADFLRRWAAGESNWDAGRSSGEVTVDGPADAWDRMLVATNYPGRPAGLTEQLLADQAEQAQKAQLAQKATSSP